MIDREQCELCGDILDIDDMYDVDGIYVCEDCYDTHDWDEEDYD